MIDFEFKEVKFFYIDLLDFNGLTQLLLGLDRYDAQIYLIDRYRNCFEQSKIRLYPKLKDHYIKNLSDGCDNFNKIARINAQSGLADFPVTNLQEKSQKEQKEGKEQIYDNKRLIYSYADICSLFKEEKLPEVNQEHLNYLISYLNNKISEYAFTNRKDPKKCIYHFGLPNKINDLGKIEQVTFDAFLKIIKEKWPKAEFLEDLSSTNQEKIYSIVLNLNIS